MSGFYEIPSAAALSLAFATLYAPPLVPLAKGGRPARGALPPQPQHTHTHTTLL